MSPNDPYTTIDEAETIRKRCLLLIGYAIHLDHPLNLSNLPQSPNGRSDGSGRRSTEGVGTTGVRLVAALASPDTNVGSLDGDLHVLISLMPGT